MKDVNEQLKFLSRGVNEIISTEGLKAKLEHSRKSKRPLAIKAGFDPTAPDIHLGHVVLLNKLRQFQDLGHIVYFLIGDFTAQIGDPTGQKKLRPKLSQKEIKRNASTYAAQVFKILDKRKTKIVFNSRWFKGISSGELLTFASATTVNQILARADFRERFEQQSEINLQEFMYPLLQAYDSVYLKADVELGGTDQKFNLLMGRQLQEYFKQSPQVVMMTPLLEGTDGVQKMSKSLENYIGINEAPKDIFGKIMSVSDELMLRYFELLTQEDLEKIKSLHPKKAKLWLGQLIVAKFYDAQTAKNARDEFEKVFSKKELPEDMQSYVFRDGDKLCEVLPKLQLASSGNEVRRLLREGAISIEGEKIVKEDWKFKPGVLRIGRRRFLKLVSA